LEEFANKGIFVVVKGSISYLKSLFHVSVGVLLRCGFEFIMAKFLPEISCRIFAQNNYVLLGW